jgi:hypothetical protein
MRSLIAKITLLLAICFVAGCGSGDSANCDALKTDMTNCLDDYCANEGSGSVVCGCWAKGQDTNQVNCECATLDWGALCGQVDLDKYEPGSLDCAQVKNSLAGVCQD